MCTVVIAVAAPRGHSRLRHELKSEDAKEHLAELIKMVALALPTGDILAFVSRHHRSNHTQRVLIEIPIDGPASDILEDLYRKAESYGIPNAAERVGAATIAIIYSMYYSYPITSALYRGILAPRTIEKVRKIEQDKLMTKFASRSERSGERSVVGSASMFSINNRRDWKKKPLKPEELDPRGSLALAFKRLEERKLEPPLSDDEALDTLLEIRSEIKDLRR